MRIIVFLFIGFLALGACKSAGDSAKNVLNKTGEVIGEGSSEFAKGLKKGVDNTFDSEVVMADALKQKGVSYGKYSLEHDSSAANKNKLIIYLIFDKDFEGEITAKVFDQKGNEYGRSREQISAKKGDAKYIDFLFDRRTDFESKSKFVME